MPEPISEPQPETMPETVPEPEPVPTPAPMLEPFEALYLHVPFCAKRCDYCDFTTRASYPGDKAMDKYVDQLILCIRRASKAGLLGGIKTLYIGGGTPSFLGEKRLVNLVYAISLSVDLGTDKEFTLEANPDSLTGAMVKDLYALGVNRISLGVQSFLDSELALLGRIHDAQQARDAIALAQSRMDSVSIDLICGLPGQSMEEWTYNLQQALEAGVDHVSIYPLTLEKGTALEKKVRRRKLPALDEDLQADMMVKAAELLEAAGLERYEVASYAKPGHQSWHNISYWSGVPYLGLGVGAASMFRAPDAQAVADAEIIPGLTQEYVDVASDLYRVRCTLGEDALFFESLSIYEAAAEDGMLAMRMSRGIGPDQFQHLESILPGFAGPLEEVLEECRRLDLVQLEDGRYFPNQRGWLLGNEIYGRIWDLAEELYKRESS